MPKLDTMPICSVTNFCAPPPPAGPFVYSASSSSPTTGPQSHDTART